MACINEPLEIVFPDFHYQAHDDGSFLIEKFILAGSEHMSYQNLKMGLEPIT